MLFRSPGGVDRLVEDDGRAVGRGDEQPQQAAVDGVLLGEHADDEADLDGRRERPSRAADPLRVCVVAHLPGQRHHAPDVGDHGAPLVGVEDEGSPARADHDAQAEGGGVGPGGPVGAGDGAAPLDLLPGGEDGRLDRADRRRRAAGGEVVAQLGPVRTRPRGYAHALDVLQADLDGDVGQVAPNLLTNAGKHSKLGELIGKSVIESVTKAIGKQVWLSNKSQSNALVRINRYALDINEFYDNLD